MKITNPTVAALIAEIAVECRRQFGRPDWHRDDKYATSNLGDFGYVLGSVEQAYVDEVDRYYGPRGAEPYRAPARGPRWQPQRKAALERDGYRCTVCWAGEDLHVHHVERFDGNLPAEPQHDLSNLVTLCATCHRLTHSGRI